MNDFVSMLVQCLLDEIMDSEFKAVNTASKTSGDRYAEDGIFMMGCARHGVPNRLYDIHGGEG